MNEYQNTALSSLFFDFSIELADAGKSIANHSRKDALCHVDLNRFDMALTRLRIIEHHVYMARWKPRDFETSVSFLRNQLTKLGHSALSTREDVMASVEEEKSHLIRVRFRAMGKFVIADFERASKFTGIICHYFFTLEQNGHLCPSKLSKTGDTL